MRRVLALALMLAGAPLSTSVAACFAKIEEVDPSGDGDALADVVPSDAVGGGGAADDAEPSAPDPFAPCALCVPTLLADGLSIFDLETNAGVLYWSDGDSILSMPSTGGAVSTLLAGAGATDLTVDHTGLYWIHPDTRQLFRADVDGGSAKAIFGSDGGTFTGIVADGENGWVWWSGHDIALRTADVGTVTRAGADAGLRFSSSAYSTVARLRGRGSSFAWVAGAATGRGRHDLYVAMRGGPARVLAGANGDIAESFGPFAVDAERAYWVYADPGLPFGLALRTKAVDQDAEATLSTGLYYDALVADDAWLYAFSLVHHRVWRVAKTGGPFLPFMDLPFESFPKLVAMIDDASNVYVASETAIWSHPK